GQNLGKLPAALDRLCQAVGGGSEPSDAPLRSWHQQNGELRLEVCGAWLAQPFERLVLPLPHNAIALALALLAHVLTSGPRANQRGKIGFRQFCERLGVPPQWGHKVTNRSVERALKLVNEGLQALQAQRGALWTKHELEPPAYYQIEA